MSSHYDYKKFAVLYVDDEEKSLVNFTRAFGDDFKVLTANSAAGGLELVRAQAAGIGVLMTDQRMPGEKGVWLLEHTRQVRPQIMRILVTAYADMDAAIDAVNSGAIYKYVSKPWDPVQLEMTLKQALEFFMVQEERDQLLREKMSVLRNMMIADRIVSLGLLAAGLSHHIRNSLVAVKTFLDLAPAKLADEKIDTSGLRNPDFWKEYYQNVQTQIEKINNMLKDLWTASEKPTFEFGDQVARAGDLDLLAREDGDVARRLAGGLRPGRRRDRHRDVHQFLEAECREVLVGRLGANRDPGQDQKQQQHASGRRNAEAKFR